jgi:PPK2 family polyphosphate:nucleotide phosphotransferase
MADPVSAYRLVDPKKLKLDDFAAGAKPLSSGKKEADQALLQTHAATIADLQNRLFAESKHALLLVLQGMDTSGKDGTLNAVLGATHPLGLRPVAFKAPTGNELVHDFLWRIHAMLPARGQIGVFNRSHYEDVIAAHVLGLVDDNEVTRRCRQINEFERMVIENGTVVLKCFLHISKDEQKVRLEARLKDPTKYWKLSSSDLVDRGRWDLNQLAYQGALQQTATERAPWWIVPSDSKLQRNLMVAHLVRKTLEGMAPSYPPLPEALRKLVIE